MHPTTTIRRLMLGALAAFVGGSAQAQAPVPRDNPPANSQPTAKAVDITVDTVTGAIVVTQGLKAQWKPAIPPGMQLIKVEPSDPAGVLIEQSMTDANRQDITGLKIGIYKLYLTVGANQNDPKAVTREFEVLVQPNYEFLKRAIARAVPTASIEIIPATGANIIIAGYVNRPEDAETVMAIARASTVGATTTTQNQGTATGPANTGPVINNYNNSYNPNNSTNVDNGGLATTTSTAVTTTQVAVGQIINAIQVGGLNHVQIEVVFASVNRSKLRERGTDLIVNGTQGFFTSTIAGLVTPGFNGGVNTIGSRANIVAGITPAGFLMAIHALKTEGLAKFLTEPKVVTQSGRPAVIRSGGQQAVLSATGGGLGSISVSLEQVGTTMSVLPIVYGNGKIYLEVAPRVRAVNNAFGITTSAGFSPGFSEQSAEASVMLESGQTFAIGGLLENTIQAQATRLPVLGELPYLGFFFSDKTYREVESELVILVTPRLVDAMDCCQVPKRVPGRETRSPDDYEFYLECLLEAPRGQRQVWNGRCYHAAYKCDPTYGIFPCKGNVCGADGNCGANGAGGCANGQCNVPTSLPATNHPIAKTPTPMTPTTPVTPTAPVMMPTTTPVAPAPLPLPNASSTSTTPVTPEAIVMPQAGTLTTPPAPVTPVNTEVSPLAAPITVQPATPGPVTPSEVPASPPVVPESK